MLIFSKRHMMSDKVQKVLDALAEKIDVMKEKQKKE